jgi:hypothetical protein
VAEGGYTENLGCGRSLINDFDFDNQILAQALRLGYRIANYGFRRLTKG